MSDENMGKTRGYLICTQCGGYYQLEDGEDPSDFDSCECGGSLGYYSTLEEFYEEPEEFYEEPDEPEPEIPGKGDRKRVLLENLSRSIDNEERTLKEIKSGKWSLMEFVAEKRIIDDVKEQKKIVDELLDEEIIDSNLITGGRGEAESFISQVREQREFLAEREGKTLNSRFLRTAVTVLLIFVVICFLYFFIAVKFT
ncbi:hypothetical protein [Methanothermobacter sp. CaT2]|nr:hypothetical protein [Methanothermobacter sp. CaT2]QHN08677.1 hypothetical protein FZP68_08085 [Methanothermobacter sp. THM-2]BAM69440.1 conserved hypothetical protein [Methanothermobacter sp. CaT2]